MVMPSISLVVVDIQGYLWLTAYFHYFTPGSLILRTRVREIPLYRVRELLDKDDVNTRRWMTRHESPYPGYCHAPGKNDCLPLLCNCDLLTEEWMQAWYPNKTPNGTKFIHNDRLYKTIPTSESPLALSRLLKRV